MKLDKVFKSLRIVVESAPEPPPRTIQAPSKEKSSSVSPRSHRTPSLPGAPAQASLPD